MLYQKPVTSLLNQNFVSLLAPFLVSRHIFNIKTAFLTLNKTKIVFFCQLSVLFQLVNTKSLYFHSWKYCLFCSLGKIKLDNHQKRTIILYITDMHWGFSKITRRDMQCSLYTFNSINLNGYPEPMVMKI